METNMATRNIRKFEDVMTDVIEFGRQAGQGRDTRIKFQFAMFEASYQGTIDTTPNKHGPGIDDATQLVSAYTAAQTGATVYDTKAPNVRKEISVGRLCIKFGGWSKGGTGEPLSTANDAIREYKIQRSKPNNKPMEDASNFFVKFARAQLKLDRVMSLDEIRELMFKPTRDLRSAEDILSGVRNSLYALRDGKAQQGTAKDDSPQVTQAIAALTERLADIAVEKGSTTNGATMPLAQAGVGDDEIPF